MDQTLEIALGQTSVPAWARRERLVLGCIDGIKLAPVTLPPPPGRRDQGRRNLVRQFFGFCRSLGVARSTRILMSSSDAIAAVLNISNPGRRLGDEGQRFGAHQTVTAFVSLTFKSGLQTFAPRYGSIADMALPVDIRFVPEADITSEI
jgi:hypothetical protein